MLDHSQVQRNSQPGCEVDGGPRTLPPPPTPPTGAALTAEKLLQAAHELLYEREGASPPVSEICERANANVAMVRYCFGSKDQLLDALVERVMRVVGDEMKRLSTTDRSPEQMLKAHVAAMVRNYFRYPYLNGLMNTRLIAADEAAVERMVDAFSRPARAWYTELLERGHCELGWREIEPTMFFFSVVGMCEFVFSGRAWLERSFDLKLTPDLLERFAEHTTSLVLSAVQPAAGSSGEDGQFRRAPDVGDERLGAGSEPGAQAVGVDVQRPGQ